MKQVDECDILLVLFDGDAGWAGGKDGNTGICHAEFSRGMQSSPGKVFMLKLDVPEEKRASGTKDSRFTADIEKHNLFRQKASDETELFSAVDKLLADACVGLIKSGVRDLSRGKFHSGEALQWSRLSFSQRADRMIETIQSQMIENGGTKLKRNAMRLSIAEETAIWRVSAIPAAFTVAAAREMVGQPFLNDHEFLDVFPENTVGPIHVIALQKAATESQAIALLGFPDATVVKAPFGIYIADNIQKIQLVLLADCRDNTSTRNAVSRFLDWLDQTGEAELLAERAKSRTRIIQAIEKEQDNG